MRCSVFCVLVAALLRLPLTGQAVEYQIAELVRNGSNVAGAGFGINENGTVAGDCQGEASVWQGGTHLGLGLTGRAEDVNELGDAVGTCGSAVLWKSDGTTISLGSPGIHSAAHSVNCTREVAGQYWDSSGVVHGVVWSQSGELVPVNWAGDIASAECISDTRLVAGCLRLSDSTDAAVVLDLNRQLLQIIAASSVGGGAIAKCINDQGQVCGHVDELDNDGRPFRRAFFWSATTGLVYIHPGASDSRAFGINDLGQVVGVSQFGTSRHAYVWSLSGGLVDLGTLGGDYSIAYAINRTGTITGMSYATSSPLERAVVWTPVPEPATAVVMLCGFAGLMCGFRRRR